MQKQNLYMSWYSLVRTENDDYSSINLIIQGKILLNYLGVQYWAATMIKVCQAKLARNRYNKMLILYNHT